MDDDPVDVYMYYITKKLEACGLMQPKLMSTLVLEHTLCCYQTRYCKLEEAQASCKELGRLFALIPR